LKNKVRQNDRDGWCSCEEKAAKANMGEKKLGTEGENGRKKKKDQCNNKMKGGRTKKS